MTFFVGVDFAPNNTAHHKCKVYKEGFFSLNHAPDLGRRGFSMSATLPYVTTRYIGTPFLFSFLQKSDWQENREILLLQEVRVLYLLVFFA